jgi:small subunit ribosomal protein S17
VAQKKPKKTDETVEGTAEEQVAETGPAAEGEPAAPSADQGEPAAAVAEEVPAEEEPEPEQPAAEEPAPEPEAAAEEEPAPEPEPEAAAEEEPAPEPEAPAEEAAAEPEGAAEPAEEAPPAKPKRKRLPRGLRRQRVKPARERPAKRKPIVRQPKPESERGQRQERRGVVVASAMDKTIVVKVDTIKAHPKYKKVVRRSTKFHAHDEQNQAGVGDVVRIVETRPLSKTKRWRLAEILEAAK